MDSSYHDEDSHLLPRSEDCSARLEHPDDSRRSSSAVVNRHRRAQHSSVTMRRDSEPSREQTEDSPRGQGHQSLSRSWNGFPGNGCVYARHDHDTVSKSVTSIRHPIDSPDNSNVMPKTPLDKADGDDVGDASRRRLQRRLMTSVVLALLCYIMGMMSLLPLQSQYLFRRFAVDFFNLTNVTMRQVPCAEGENDSLQDDLNEIQTRTSQQLMLMEYAQFIPAIVVSVFIGSYADYLGRKYLVFVPLVGGCLKSLLFFLVIYLELDVNYLFLAYAVDGVSGSFYALLLGLSASIADVTTSSRQRVLFFAVLEIILAVAGGVSQIGTGYLINGLGFVAPSLIICCLLFVGCVCLLIFMPETLRKPDRIILNPLVHLRKVFGFYFFDGSLLQRGLFGLSLLIFFLITMINLGKMSVETLYVMNSPLCWDSVQIGFFIGIRLLVQNLTAVLVLKVLSKWLRIEIIGMLGLLSGAAGFVVEAFADSDLMMYTSAIAGLIVTVVSPIVRTLLSRMAPAESQGALFSSVSVIEAVCHLASTTMYIQVYTATLDVFPGAVFLLMTASLLVNFVLLILFAIVSRKVLYLEDIQTEVNVDTDVAICHPSSSSPLSSSSGVDETWPLLEHQHNSVTRNGHGGQTGMKSKWQPENKLTSSC